MFKGERIDAEEENLHCSNGGSHSSHQLSSFFVKALSFKDGIVSVQMNGGCIERNDVCRDVTNPLFNPSTSLAVSAHRVAGGCGLGYFRAVEQG